MKANSKKGNFSSKLRGGDINFSGRNQIYEFQARKSSDKLSSDQLRTFFVYEDDQDNELVKFVWKVNKEIYYCKTSRQDLIPIRSKQIPYTKENPMTIPCISSKRKGLWGPKNCTESCPPLILYNITINNDRGGGHKYSPPRGGRKTNSRKNSKKSKSVRKTKSRKNSKRSKSAKKTNSRRKR